MRRSCHIKADVVHDQLRRLFPDAWSEPSAHIAVDDVPVQLAALLEDPEAEPETIIAVLARIIGSDPKATDRAWWPRAESILIAMAPDYLLALAEQLSGLRNACLDDLTAIDEVT